MKASELRALLDTLIEQEGDCDIQVDTVCNDDWMDVTEVYANSGMIVLHAFDLRAGE